MASVTQFEPRPAPEAEKEPRFFSIGELATRWRCCRGSVYNILRGERVVDFARPGHRGHKLVPVETVRRIEAKRMKVLR